MGCWQKQLSSDPILPLMSSGNGAVDYFVKRDLLEEKVEPISCIWQLPEVQTILKKQQPDGSWPHHGRRTVSYPRHHYGLSETWKQFRLLVERYELTSEHPAAEKAADFIFSCQTGEGDIRGFLANQYATYYTGAVMALLIRARYEEDSRIERGFKWLLSMRQNDGGWTIPILTRKYDGKTMHMLTSQYAEPVQPDRTKPFSHNCTDMVLRAFAAHPKYRKSKEAQTAGDLLKSRFFHADSYSSYRAASYWVRFLFWWPNLVTALDSLSLMGFSKNDQDIKKALDWLVQNQEPSGLWRTTYVNDKKESKNKTSKERRLWLTLAISRIFKRFHG